MQTKIQEIYQNNILPLSEADQLMLAALIVEKVTRKGSKEKGKRPSIRSLFGKGRSNDTQDADNEKIDADLRASYLDTHDD
jgi:hypothetical protein